MQQRFTIRESFWAIAFAVAILLAVIRSATFSQLTTGSPEFLPEGNAIAEAEEMD